MSTPLHRVISAHSPELVIAPESLVDDRSRRTRPRVVDDQRARARCLACVFHADRGVPLKVLALHYGVCHETIRNWVAIGRSLNDPILDTIQEVFSLLIDPDDHA